MPWSWEEAKKSNYHTSCPQCGEVAVWDAVRRQYICHGPGGCVTNEDFTNGKEVNADGEGHHVRV